MHGFVAFLALMLLAGQVPARGQAPARPFQASAQFGVPYTLGFPQVVIGSNEPIDTGTLRVLTLTSARLAGIYPNRVENISAGAKEKLLILRGALQNPSRVVLPIGSSHFLGIRFWDGQGNGPFRYVGIYDPETHAAAQGNLKTGESLAFECVIRVPAGFTSFRVGLYHENTAKTAWFDLNPVLGKIASAFSPEGLTMVDRVPAQKNQAFDFDIFRMNVLGMSSPAAIGGVSKGDRPLNVVSVEVTNAMLLPARWGWQYVTPELVMRDGSTLAGVRDLIDKATDKTWSGDLPVGATMTAQFIFRPEPGQVPVAFRLTSLANQRTVEVSF